MLNEKELDGLTLRQVVTVYQELADRRKAMFCDMIKERAEVRAEMVQIIQHFQDRWQLIVKM